MNVDWDEISESLKRQEYDELLNKYKDDSGALTDIGVSLAQIKNQRAENFFRRAIAVNDTAQARYNMGLFLEDVKNDYSEAEKEYIKAIEKDPKDAMPHNNLGILLAESGELKESEKLLKKSVELKEFEWFINNLGVIYFRKSEESVLPFLNLIKSVKNFKKAHALNQKETIIKNNLRNTKQYYYKVTVLYLFIFFLIGLTFTLARDIISQIIKTNGFAIVVLAFIFANIVYGLLHKEIIKDIAIPPVSFERPYAEEPPRQMGGTLTETKTSTVTSTSTKSSIKGNE